MHVWPILVRRMCRVLAAIAGLFLAVMLLLTLADVVGRAFGKPIYGTYEIISYLGAIVFGFSLPYTSLRKHHVFVEFMIEILPRNVGNVMQVATRLLGIALFLWMGWNFVVMSLDMKKANDLTQVFRVPYYPVTFALAFCCIVQCLPLFLQISEILGGRDE
jgi:TRAP-type C4-dicarboxylate transport system permease small subunit